MIKRPRPGRSQKRIRRSPIMLDKNGPNKIRIDTESADRSAKQKGTNIAITTTRKVNRTEKMPRTLITRASNRIKTAITNAD